LFSGILHQKIAVRMLQNEIRLGTLPRTMLFYGPDGSGKFHTAVEVVRIQSCREKGEPGCGCASCTAVRRLASVDVFVICRSNLANSFDLWGRFGFSDENRQYLIRDLERFLKSIAADGRYEKEYRYVSGVIGSRKELEKKFNELIGIVTDIIRSACGRVITIDQIREAQRFLSHRSGFGGCRVLVIDGAESMNDEAQNSFLKVSEDTPEGSLIILTTVNKEQLRPTIVSRCRLYRFSRLTDDQKSQVLTRRWPGYKAAVTLHEGQQDEMRTVCDRLQGGKQSLQQLRVIADEINKKGNEAAFFDYFLTLLKGRIDTLRDAPVKSVFEFEQLLQDTEMAKRSIIFSNSNREVVFFNFLLNNIQKIVKYSIAFPCFHPSKEK
jgi:DNA polymerase III delta prime subunit